MSYPKLMPAVIAHNRKAQGCLYDRDVDWHLFSRCTSARGTQATCTSSATSGSTPRPRSNAAHRTRSPRPRPADLPPATRRPGPRTAAGRTRHGPPPRALPRALGGAHRGGRGGGAPHPARRPGLLRLRVQRGAGRPRRRVRRRRPAPAAGRPRRPPIVVRRGGAPQPDRRRAGGGLRAVHAGALLRDLARRRVALAAGARPG